MLRLGCCLPPNQKSWLRALLLLMFLLKMRAYAQNFFGLGLTLPTAFLVH